MLPEEWSWLCMWTMEGDHPLAEPGQQSELDVYINV